MSNWYYFSPWKISLILFLFPMPLGVAAFTFCLINISGFYKDHYHPSATGGLQVAYLAHLVGFLVGILLGIILSPSWKKNLIISIIQFVCYYVLILFVFHFVIH